MTERPNAKYTIDGNCCTMTFVRDLPQPVERVWRALTDPAELTIWFYPFIGTLAVGESVVIPWEENGGLQSTIVEFDPPRVFAWTWHKPGEPESIVRWSLEPLGAGSRLTLSHSLPILDASEPTNTLAGWQVHLDGLVDHLNGNDHPWSATVWRSLKDQYAFDIATPGDGIVEVVNGHPQLRLSRILQAPLQRVWEALTTSEGIRGWFVEGEVDLRSGGSYTLDFGRFGAGKYEYDIVELDPPRVVAFRFGAAPEDIARFELFDGDDRTLLVLTNRIGPDVEPWGNVAGWHYHLDRLPSYLAGEPDPRPADHIQQLNAHYQALRETALNATA